MAWAATIRVKLAELTLVERILRKIAPMKPHAQLCHEFAFVLHVLDVKPSPPRRAANASMWIANAPTQDALAHAVAPSSGSVIIRLL
jgi:hypothetical protein